MQTHTKEKLQMLFESEKSYALYYTNVRNQLTKLHPD